MFIKVNLAVLGLVSAFAVQAASIPQSQCFFTAVPGFNCDLYPVDSVGLFDGHKRVDFPLGYDLNVDPITPGYLILDNNYSAVNPYDSSVVDPNIKDWTQVLWFVDPTGLGNNARYMILFTPGCDLAQSTDRSCFPALQTILDSGSYAFLPEPTTGIVTYNPCSTCSFVHTYTIHLPAGTISGGGAAAAAATPEPTTFGLMAGAMAIIAGRIRRRKRAGRSI